MFMDLMNETANRPTTNANPASSTNRRRRMNKTPRRSVSVPTPRFF